MSGNVVRHIICTVLSPSLVQYSLLAAQSFVQILCCKPQVNDSLGRPLAQKKYHCNSAIGKLISLFNEDDYGVLCVLLKHLAGGTYCGLFLKYDQRGRAYRNAAFSCFTQFGKP